MGKSTEKIGWFGAQKNMEEKKTTEKVHAKLESPYKKLTERRSFDGKSRLVPEHGGF